MYFAAFQAVYVFDSLPALLDYCTSVSTFDVVQARRGERHGHTHPRRAPRLARGAREGRLDTQLATFDRPNRYVSCHVTILTFLVSPRSLCTKRS